MGLRIVSTIIFCSVFFQGSLSAQDKLTIEVSESLRAFDMSSPESRLFQSYIHPILEKLVGRPEFLEHKPQVLLLDEESPNAYYLKGFYPPVFAMTKGLFKKLQTEGQIAFVLGHEWAHFMADRDFRAGRRNTKLEEQAADLMAIRMMRTAGYDVTESYDFMRILIGDVLPEDDGSFKGILGKVLDIADPHPVDSERLRAVEQVLTVMENKIGELSRERSAIPSDVTKLQDAKNSTDYIQSRLVDLDYTKASLEEKADILFEILENNTGWSPERLKSFSRELAKFVGLTNELFEHRPFELLTDEVFQKFSENVIRRNKILSRMSSRILNLISKPETPVEVAKIYAQVMADQRLWDPEEVILALEATHPGFASSANPNFQEDGLPDTAEQSIDTVNSEDERLRYYWSRAKISWDLEEAKNLPDSFRNSQMISNWAHQIPLTRFTAELFSLDILPAKEREEREPNDGPSQFVEVTGKDMYKLIREKFSKASAGLSEELMEIRLLSETFLHENNSEKISHLAVELLKRLDRLSLPREAVAQSISVIPSQKKGQKASWNKALLVAAAGDSNVTKALWRIGVEDPRLYELIPEEEVLSYFSNAEGYAVSFSPAHSLFARVNEMGDVLDVVQGFSIQELSQESRTDFLTPLYRKLFVAALFNPEKRTELLEFVRDNPAMDGDLVMGNFLSELPEHVLELNRHLLKDPDRFPSAEALKTQFRKAIEKNDPEINQFIYRFFSSEDEMSFAKLILGPNAKRLDYKDYVDFILEIPDSVFPLTSRLKLIWESTKISQLEGAPFREMLIRKIVEQRSVDTALISELSLFRPKLDQAAYELFLSEVISRFLQSQNVNEENLIEILSVLKKQIPHEYRQHLDSLVDKLPKPRSLHARAFQLFSLHEAGFLESRLTHFTREFGQILEKIEKTKDLQKRISLLKDFAIGRRIYVPALRQKVRSFYSELLLEKFGKDDGSDEFYQKLSGELKSWGVIDSESKFEQWLSLAETVELQSQTLYRIQKEFGSIQESALALANTRLLQNELIQAVLSMGVPQENKERSEKISDALIEFLEKDITSESIDRFLKKEGGLLILNSTKVNAQGLMTYLSIDPDSSEERDQDRSWMQHPYDLFIAEIELARAEPPSENYRVRAQMLYDNYWSSSLPARAAFLDSVMHPNSSRKSSHTSKSVERLVERILEKDSPLSQKAAETMQRYISILPEYQRGLMVAALLATERASDSDSKDSALGARLGLLLDMKGPAEAKFSQGIHSFPETPDELKEGLGDSKASQNISRVEVLETYLRRLPEELRARVKRQGRILGAASYYIVLELEMKDGTRKAVRMLRLNAKEQADIGFKYLELLAAGEEDKKVAEVLVRIIQHARGNAETETDSSIGARQSELAGTIYDNVEIEIEDHTFNFKTYPFKEVGDGYAVLDFAAGLKFKDLPDSKQKRLLSEAYIRFELEQILSGSFFDHDRHEGQILVDGNQIAILDHGGLSLEKPTSAQLSAFGELLVDAIASSTQGSLSFDRKALLTSFNKSLQKDEFSDPEIKEYLVSIQRGLLAMGNFFSAMDPDANGDANLRLSAHIEDIFKQDLVHPEILSGILKGFENHPNAYELFTKLMGSSSCDSPLKKLGAIQIRRPKND